LPSPRQSTPPKMQPIWSARRMQASNPASILNQNQPDLGIPIRFRLKSSRFSSFFLGFGRAFRPRFGRGARIERAARPAAGLLGDLVRIDRAVQVRQGLKNRSSSAIRGYADLVNRRVELMSAAPFQVHGPVTERECAEMLGYIDVAGTTDEVIGLNDDL